MEKNVKVSILLQTYGNLLTENQVSVLNDYYNNDLSLSEIAENNNITRQAVRDNIKKGEQKLFEFEEKLGVMKKTMIQEQKISEILSKITTIEAKSSDKKVQHILEEVRAELNCLV